jgi:hypothetical protein
MKLKKTALSTAVLVTLGLGGMAVGPLASAAVLPNGIYRATINNTPLTNDFATPTPNVVPGTDGAWNSTFSFSSLPTKHSQYMEDNDADINCGAASGTCGSSVLGKGAGSWTMAVNGGTFTTSNFQVDSIPHTAGGTFVEYGSVNGGTIDQTTGAVTLDATGRVGSVSNYSSSLFDEPWNIPDSTPGVYTPLITGTSSNYNASAVAGTTGTITGRGIVANGDGTYNMILVSASYVGSAWGGFDGNPYMETWNVNLAPVPIPAAAWLFGSGLIGLVGIARRKKSS